MSRLLSLLANSGIGRAFRHRTFTIYISAHGFSVIGLWIQRIAIQWTVWTLTGSYAWLAAMALVESMTSMCCSLASGPLADRFDRVRLALLTQGLLMVLATGLAIVTMLDLISIPVLAGFVILTGLLEGVWAPVRLALMPNMVPRADMPAAVAITSMIFTAAIFVGPAIGGVIIALVGVEGAFIANAVSYMGLLLVFALLKIPRQAVREDHSNSFIADMKIGFLYVLRQRSLRTAVLFAVGFALLVRPYRELFAGIADEIFHRGSDGLAALASAGGFGALVGAIGIAIYGRNQGIARAVYWAAACSALLLMSFASSNYFTLSLVMAAGLSACATIIGTGSQMLIQMNVSDAMRGRVMSVWDAQFRGVPTIGAWLMGLLEPVLGIQAVLLGSACVFLCFTFLTRSWQTDLRRLEEHLAGAEELQPAVSPLQEQPEP